MKLHVQLLTFAVLVLFVSAAVPHTAAEAQISDGYEVVWSGDLNITVYTPLATPVLALQSQRGQQNLAAMAAQYSAHANRPVSVTYDADRGLLAVTTTITFSTSSKAIRYADVIQPNNRIKLDATTSNDTQNIYDIIPDETATEEATRSAIDLAGKRYVQTYNNTDVDVTSPTTIDFTDYNHSIADWVLFDDFRLNSAANATVKVNYAFSNGTAYETQNVTSTDLYIAAEDVFFQLPQPSLAAASYVASITVDDVQFSRFEMFRFSADYEDGDIYSMDSVATAPTLLGLFSGFSSAVTNGIKAIKAPVQAAKTAQRGVGFSNMRDAALNAVSAATGIQKSTIVDHTLNTGKSLVSIPSKLSSHVYNGMKSAWNGGQKNAQALARKARSTLHAVTVSVGVTAKKFGKAAMDAATNTRELGSKVIAQAAKNGGKAISASTAAGASLFDKAKDALGRIPAAGASLFTKLNPANLLKAPSWLKWVLVAVAVVVAIIFIMKVAMPPE